MTVNALVLTPLCPEWALTQGKFLVVGFLVGQTKGICI